MKLTELMEQKMATEAQQMFLYLSKQNVSSENMAEKLSNHLGTSNWEFKGNSNKTIKCKPYGKVLKFTKPNSICIDSKPIATLVFVGEKIKNALIQCLRYENACIYEFDFLNKKETENGYISIDCEEGQIMLLCKKSDDGNIFADWIIKRLKG